MTSKKELEDQNEKMRKALEKLSTSECFGNGEALGLFLRDYPLGREVLARMKIAQNVLDEIKYGTGENNG